MNIENTKQQLKKMEQLSGCILQKISETATELERSEAVTKESLKQAQEKLDNISRILNKE